MDLASPDTPLRVAIVGSGPSGCFALEELLKSDAAVTVDVFDRLATPFGLVRAGVAPDHQKIKNVTVKFEKLFSNENVQFWGNVEIGSDLPIETLREFYDCIILSHGTESDRKLSIPGINLENCHSATEFVGWYNAHPDYKSYRFDLQGDSAVIIGQGNVAVDVARILAKPVNELSATDIAGYAQKALSESKIKNIYLVGRRGPAQTAFTDKELRELTEIDDCFLKINPGDLELGEQCQAELSESPKSKAARNYKLLTSALEREYKSEERIIHLVFFASPIEVKGQDKISSIVFAVNKLEGPAGSQKAVNTSETFELKASIMFTSIGYKGEGIKGLPFDVKRGVYPNEKGRIMDGDNPVKGMYVSGWIKRGPTGVIGTNKADSVETVKTMLEDMSTLKPCEKRDSDELLKVLESQKVKVVNYEGWSALNEREIDLGHEHHKIREKFSSTEDMLDYLKK